MNDNRTLFIEEALTGAVKRLLTGRVNELLGEIQFAIPLIELENYGDSSAISPSVVLASCERTEKERIIRLDAYSLSITFSLPETPESELHCYAYTAAVCKALGENPTLDGVTDRAVVTGKKYVPPKKAGCGQGWEVVITLRLTVEGAVYAG